MYKLSLALLSAWLLLAGTATAHADPISIALLSWIGITATAGSVLVAVTTFALSLAVSMGLSYLTAVLSKKSQTDTPVGGTVGKLQGGGAVPRSFIVGRSMTAGSLVYGNTFGQDGKTPNAYLVQVIALGDLPHTALAGILVGGEPVTWNPNATPETDGIVIPEYTKNAKNHLWVRFYNGTQTVADARLVSLFGSNPDRPYSSRRIGTGVAYAVVTSLVNQELFSGFPQIKFVLDGVPLYDRRYDTTAGGLGLQRWSDPSTWALTANNAVIIENILRGISYAGKWLYGARTVSVPQLPSASWMAAASECDEAIVLAGGGTEPQFYAGGEIQLNVQPADAIEELLKGCNGKLAEIGGVYKMRAGAPGAAVFSFTDADILSTEQQTFDPFPSLGQVINAVTAKYRSPAEAWNEKDAPPLYDAGLEGADGGRRQVADVRYGFVTSGTMVQRLMRAERNDNRAWRRHALPMPPDGFVLEPLDVVSLTSTRNGYTAKSFEILAMEDLPNGNVGIAIKELDPNAYNWAAATDEKPVVDGAIKIIRPPSQPIVAWFAEPYTLVDGDVKRPAIRLAWDPNTDDVDGVRYEVRYASTLVVILTGETDRFDAGSIIISQNLLPNTVYGVRGQYRPASPRPVSWSDWLAVTTPDVRLSLADFESGLRNLVESIGRERLRQIDEALNQIGILIAEQDAHNDLDKETLRREIRRQLGLASASFTELVTVSVGPGSAIAQQLIVLAAAIDGVEATLTARFIAGVNLGGALAAYDLQLRAFDGLHPVIKVGMRLLAYTGGIGIIQLDADTIVLGRAGSAGVAPFIFDVTLGRFVLDVPGGMIVNGAITAQKISVGTLSAIVADLGLVTAGRMLLGAGKIDIDGAVPHILIFD